MHIEWVRLKGYRNFLDALINLRKSTLIIGANDVGKTNLLHGLRILLDRSLPEIALDPHESDFHINAKTGKQVGDFEICIKFTNIDKDAVISNLKGAVSEKGEAFIRYTGTRGNLSHVLQLGAGEDLLEEISGRHYLKFIQLRYIQSQRDLSSFVQSEKRHLLRISKEGRTPEQAAQDEKLTNDIGNSLSSINSDVGKLHYVKSATHAVNEELRELSHHHNDYEVRLETGAIQASEFIEKLELSGSAGGSPVGLGGDGRNNQILMALWKAKSEREQDAENEFLIYCIEEPEAHLHPHQQRKLSDYLVKKLKGQVFVTSHSPQIAARFSPNSIVRIVAQDGASAAASNGCSKCVEDAWLDLGYRMSVLPAEAFFAEMVLLVEGPSEVLFYRELAKQLDIDLDQLNISILSIDGIDFNVYASVLKAMHISWSARTDNDVSEVQKSNPKMMRYAGINRALRLVDEDILANVPAGTELNGIEAILQATLAKTSPKGVFLSKSDLENDLVNALQAECLEFTGCANVDGAVKKFQSRKATNMGDFLRVHRASLKKLQNDALAAPLKFCVHKIVNQ